MTPERLSHRQLRFLAARSVTDGLVSDFGPTIRSELEAILSRPLRGPRGGRYEGFGEVSHSGPALVGDDFMRGTQTFVARRMARYVRPKHR